MYEFARRPVWILSHFVIGALILLAIGLGFWQRSRYYEETSKQQRLDALAARDPVPLSDVVDPALGIGEVGRGIEFTRVEVVGSYDTDAEVAIRNRTYEGSPGAWVLTPLIQEDGTAVPVVRGWITYDATGRQTSYPDAAPPGGQVTVTGVLQLTQDRGSLGAVDPAGGVLGALSRVDLRRFAQQLDYPLAPVWVMLDGQDPPQQGDLPAVVELSAGDASQNFGYMAQWWIFAVIGLVGYPLILRRVGRNRELGDQVPDLSESAHDGAGLPDREGPVEASRHPGRSSG